ncbi:transglutaminase domain-containing protein [Novibacillus thermophilus]|nr:transglutaminase-like domain-containing protein [Novibacillus thermophilus]
MGKLCVPFLLITVSLMAISGCSGTEVAGTEEGEQGKGQIESTSVPIKLTPYAEEVGASLEHPESQVLSVRQSFRLAGRVRDAEQLMGSHVWVYLDGPKGGSFDYYLPMEGGHFEGEIRLFEGEGVYNVTVRVPDKETADRFYDIATLEVTNKSTEITRDVALRPPGLEANLRMTEPASGYVEADGTLSLAGTVGETFHGQTIVVKEEKDGESSELLLPVEDGAFAGDIPLYYGAGLYDITVMVPDSSREDTYLEAAHLLVSNESTTVMEPITYYKHYYEHKFQLDEPKGGGLQAGETFRVSGSLDLNLEENQNVEQLIVTTEKDGEEASYLIPIHDGRFDGEFWLRFGPGEYEVTLNVPTDPGAEQSYFKFAGVASFRVLSDAEDGRYLMPSRGIQADAPAIEKLAEDLTRGKNGEREKAKAIYEYVAKTVKYDVRKLENDAFKLDDSALKTLESQKGVCQDYAFLTVALLRSIGIESRYIGGTAQSGSFVERHAWVEAKVNGEWVVMDPTWGAGYVQDGRFVAHYDPQYFDPDSQTFEKTHRREEIVY